MAFITILVSLTNGGKRILKHFLSKPGSIESHTIVACMNIGFDAKRAYHNGTGLGNYSRSLIQSLALNFPQHQYFSFNPKPSLRFSIPPLSNLQQVFPQKILHKKLSAVWRSKWMLQDLEQLQINLYHGLSNELPLGINQKGIRSVVTIHDLIFERYPQQYNPLDVMIYRQKYKQACKEADKVIAISLQTKNDLVQLYSVEEKKIEVCYQSCNPLFEKQVSVEEKEMLRQKYNLPQHYILSVGSIIERKNLMNVCKALQILKDEFHLPLVVVGDGKGYKKKIEHFLKEASLQNSVIFLNEKEAVRNDPHFKSGKNFPALYQMADALIYPSLYEGFGIPVLEALWSRIPVITSSTSCLPEAGGAGAIYVDPVSAQQIADALLLLKDKTKMQQRVEQGWAHAQNFTLPKTASAVMDVYMSAMQ